MSVLAGQSLTADFTVVGTTGALVNGDSLPTGTLVISGTDNAATVTVTNKTTGIYKAAVTVPATVAIGDVVQIRVNATVSTVASAGYIFTGTVEVSDVLYSSARDQTGFVGASTTQFLFSSSTLSVSSAINGGLKGRIFSIISGTGAGIDRVIAGSSYSTYQSLTFETALETTPDATSVWVIRRGRNAKLDSSLRPSALDSNGGAFIGEHVDHSLNCCYRISANGAITTYAAASDSASARGDALVAARTAASAGDTIRVYASADIPEQLAKNGVNWWFADGVTIAGQGDINIFQSDAMTFNVRGGAKFSAPGDARIIMGNDVGDLDIECESMYSESDLIDKDGGTVTIKCKRMESPTAAIANWGMSLTVFCPQIVASVTHGTTLGTVGRTHIIGANINSTAQAVPTITADVAGVVLEDCRLVTKSTETNSFYGAAATTVTLAGKTTYNKAVHANISLRYIDANVSQWLGTAPATPTTAGVPKVDTSMVGGQTATATGAVDFDDLGAGGGDSGLSGPSSVTLTFKDASNVVVPNVEFTVVGQGSARASALGVKSFGLNDGTYTVVAAPVGTTLFANYTLVVSGATTATITGTTTTVSVPSDPTKCVVNGYTRDAKGDIVASKEVEFKLIRTDDTTGTVVHDNTVTVTSGADGYFEIELPQGWIYQVRPVGAGKSQKLLVSDDASQAVTVVIA